MVFGHNLTLYPSGALVTGEGEVQNVHPIQPFLPRAFPVKVPGMLLSTCNRSLKKLNPPPKIKVWGEGGMSQDAPSYMANSMHR